MDDLARRLAVARGDEPADVVVRGGRVLSVFTREWLDADIAIAAGRIAGLGDYDGDEFARLVLPLGTTAVVLDPHELANVLGTDGVHWLLDACDALPLDFYFMASSSIPASAFESPRRPLLSGDLESLLRRRRVLGLAEMMNFPGVINADPAELEKMALANGVHVDGHAPGVLGRALNAYVAAGIRSEPEVTLKSGRPVDEIPEPDVPEWVKHSVRNRPVTADDFRIPWNGGKAR